MSHLISVDIVARQGQFETECRFRSEGGGITALFGPSGAGKTTALRAIAGLVPNVKGRIALGDNVLLDSRHGVDMPAEKRRLGFVFQEGRLLPHLSVADNLAYGRHGGRGPTSRDLARMAGFLGIEHLLSRRPRTLSGGERQRVAIGRAMLSKPSLLLMDEPLASLDPARRAELLPMIETLRDEAKMPIVFVSHNVEEVARLADTLVVMKEGRTVAAGAAMDVFASFEADPVLGRREAGALVEGRVMRLDDEYGIATIEIGDQRIELPQDGFTNGQTIRLRVLASDVSIATGEPGQMANLSIRNRLKAKVETIRHDPGSPYAELKLAIDGGNLRSRVTRKSLDQMAIHQSDTVYALIKAVSVERRL